MYTDYFNLREEPFQVTPNPKFLFLSNIHKEAIQKLVDGIRRRKGFIELVGMAGTGKTLLCKELIQMLSPEMEIAYLFYPVLNEQALYSSILKQWGIEAGEDTPVPALLERISAFLRGRFEMGRNALIILDEAQNLSLPLLENLRLLSNLETESEKLLQILLAGQPEFHALLKSGKIPQLDQRIRVRVFLEPLDRQTLPLYVFHRLNMAGAGNAVSFTDDAFDLIYKASRGIPRMINAMCERSLEEAALRKRSEIDGTVVKAAREGLEGMEDRISKTGKSVFRTPRKRLIPLAITAILVALSWGIVWYARKPVAVPPKEPKSRPMVSTKIPRVVKPPVQAPAVEASREFSVPLPRPRALRIMKNFLDGMLAVPEGKRLSWGILRLAKRDISWFTTPFLLHVADGGGATGWICVRTVHKNGFQVWKQGMWRPLDDKGLATWTGRCAVPYWMASLPERGRALRRGARGEAVTDLQTWLVNLGRLSRVTGIYDVETETGVREFQDRRGLTPDGVAGMQTLALLFQMGHVRNH